MSGKILTLKLRDTYNVSPIISKITPEEWEIVLDYVGALLSKHETLSNKFNETSIKEALTIKYGNQISALQVQTASYEAEIEEMKSQMTLLTKSHKKELAQAIKEQRQTIEQEYKTMMEDKYSMLLQSEQNKLAIKDSMIDNLNKQLQNLHSTISQSYNNQLSQLQNKLDAYEKKQDELKLRYQQQLDEVVSNTRDIVKKQIEAQYIDQLSKLQKDLSDQEQQLRSKLDAYESKYDELKSRHQQQLDEVVSNTRDIVKKQIDAQYIDQLSKLQKDLSNQEQQLRSKLDAYEVKYDELKSRHQQQLDEVVLNTRESIKKQIDAQYIDQISKLQKDLAEQEKQYKLRNEEMTKNIETKYSSQLAAQKQIESQHLEQLSKLKKDLAEQEMQHKLQQESLAKDIESKYSGQLVAQKQVEEQYKARLEQYESNLAVISKLDSLDTKLTPMLKHYGGSNNERGTSGENMIYNLITTENTYLDAIVEDTSGQTARGDIMFSWRQLKCLIEVKNKKTLTKKDDMDKFIRDIESSIDSKHKINCAIFVSIDTDIIPGRNRDIIQLEFVRNIPVIYIYTPPPCKEIHYAISCLEKIINTKVSTNEQEKELQAHFKNYYNHIITYQKYFEKTLDTKRKEIVTLTKHLNVFNVLYDQLTPVHLSMTTEDDSTSANPNENPNENVPMGQDESIEIPQDRDQVEIESVEPTKVLVGEPEEQYQQFVDAFIELALAKNTIPTITTLCRYFNVNTSVITNLGGYKKITSDAKIQFTKTIVPDAKVKLIMKYHSINGVFPSRPELIAHKMVSDGSIRKLNKVVKTKKILDYIYDYCRSTKLVESNPVENEVNPEDPIPEVNTQVVEDTPVTPATPKEVVEEDTEVKPEPKSSSKKVIKSMSTKIMKKRTLPKKVPIDEPVESTE